MVVSFLSGSLSPTPADAADLRTVSEQIQEEGLSRVIVEFQDASFNPGLRPGLRKSRDHRQAERTRAGIERGLSRAASRGIRRFDHLPIVALYVTEADLARLAANPDVVAIYPDRLHAPTLAQSVPHVGGTPTVAAGFGGQNTAIAIIDTGVDASHPNFNGRVVEEACFSAGGDCPGGFTSLIGPGSGAHCDYSAECFHGTHVAGIAAGGNLTYRGVAPGADIVAVQVFSQFTGTDCGTAPSPCPLAFTSDIIAGLVHVRSLTTVDVAAVNLSLGSGEFMTQAACEAADPGMAAEIATVRAAGIAPVVSTGNDGFVNAIGSPACMGMAISVGSVSDADAVAADSNSSSFLDLLGVGVSIDSSVPPSLFGGTHYGNASGTSMAAPHVAGSFALLRSLDGTLTVTEMLDALKNSGPLVTDPKSGVTTPRIQIDAAAHSLDRHPCFNGLDDDGDGQTDYPSDLGCATGFADEAPACQDGVDNDGDGGIDYAGGPSGEAQDPQCGSPHQTSENAPPGCGLGPELALILPALAIWRSRRRRA